MNSKISEKMVRDTLKGVKHPSIDKTLFDLGIIKDVRIEEDKAIIVLAFPFENIPIKENLINLVKEPLNEINIKTEINITTMDQEELQRFLEAENANWRE